MAKASKSAVLTNPSKFATESSVVINHDEGEVLVLGIPKHFPPKQYQLLRTVVSQNGKIVSREALIDIMYPDTDSVDHRSVDQQVCRIRKTLGKRVASYLKTVGGRGYRWSEA